MKAYVNLTSGVLCPSDLSGRDYGIRFLKLLEKHPWIKPDRFGNWEPVTELYQGHLEAISKWKDPFLWTSKSGAEGSVWFGHGERHGCIFIHSNPKRVDQNAATE